MKKIEGIPGYIIFFDNIRVDPFVKSFSTQLSNDGAINRANIEMIYLPELDRFARKGAIGGTTYYEDSIENMTNCKIFVKNIFNNRYTIVFDGNIRAKTVSESPNGNTLTYTAVDHIEALNKTIAPLAVPYFSAQIQDEVVFKLKAQGIDADKLPSVQTYQELNFKDKKISEILNTIKTNALAYNRIYSDASGASSWNDPAGRIQLMGDINDAIMESEVLDYRINPNALSADNMYVILNDILQKLMFEFYQDRDGVIRIKPPFWNEKILLNHVIDSSMVLNYAEHTAWERMYSRVITTGGMLDIEEQQYSDNDLARTLYTPMGVYLGEIHKQGIWADSRYGLATTANTTDNYEMKFSGNQTGVSYLDIGSIGRSWEDDGYGVVWHLAAGGQLVTHLGLLGTVTFIGDDYYSDRIRELEGKPTLGQHVIIRLEDGPYRDCEILYGHLSKVRVKVGQKIGEGADIGVTSTNTINNPFRIEIRKSNYGMSEVYGEEYKQVETVDPIVYLRDFTTNKINPTIYDVETIGINNVINPSNFEKKYGAAVYNTTQPLIKIANQEAFSSENAYKALKDYSAFIFNMLNSMVKTATVTMIGAPWLRPGMNCWLSPTKNDKVYYIASISHQGDPQTGVYTSLNLIHGRDSKEFFMGSESIFGTLRDKKDNIFINQINIKPDAFGPVVNDLKQYNELRKMATEFHNTLNDGIIKADKCSYLVNLYGTLAKSTLATKVGGSKLTSYLFTDDLTIEDVQSKLNAIYANAPQVVKDRCEKTKQSTETAKKYAYKRYINSVFKK